MLLSSHVVSDLERVCDHLVVLVDSAGAGRGRRRGRCSRSHHRLTGPRRDPARLPADQQVVSASHTDRQTHARGPHRRRRSSTRPGRSAASASRTWCSPTWTAPDRAAAGRPRRWRCCDDLADLAAVPRPGRRRLRRGRGRRRLVLAVTGPRLADLAATQPDVFDLLTRATGTCSTPASPCSPWRPPSSGPSGARRWSPASWRPAPTGWPGTRASPAPGGWPSSSGSRRSQRPSSRSACSRLGGHLVVGTRWTAP